jgi:sulfatase modifying factor 1
MYRLLQTRKPVPGKITARGSRFSAFISSSQVLRMICSYKHDIAISVAEEDCCVAKQLGEALKKRNIKYYLYTEHRASNWGRHILKICLDAFDADALFVLMITSETYVDKYWTDIEVQIMQVSKKIKGNYVLQLRLDPTRVDGVSKYVISETWKNNPEEIADLILAKLNEEKRRRLILLLRKLAVIVPAIFLFACMAFYVIKDPEVIGNPNATKSPLVSVAEAQKKPIESAAFTMGSSHRPEDSPPHIVNLDAYRISQTEVTVAEYRRYCLQEKKPMPQLPYTGEYENRPIVNVTWQEALEYCQWAGGRLPTEAEWEYAAARGYATKYAGGNNARDVAIYGNQKPSITRKKKSNDFDLYDMTGNAAEWCSDWYEPGYTAGEVTNPQGPSAGTEKVVRGGSCTSSITPVNQLHVTYRDKLPPGNRSPVVGFRVAWDVSDN